MREESLHSRLRRCGFVDPTRAESLIAEPALSSIDIVAHLDDFSFVPDPDQSVLALIRLAEATEHAGLAEDFAMSCDDEEDRRHLLSLLGMSSSLGDFLIAHPHVLRPVMESARSFPTTNARIEREIALCAVGADPGDEFPVARLSGADGINALRVAYFTRVAALAACDLTSDDPLAIMPSIGAAMSDIVAGALEAALAVARADTENADKVGLTIVALGKTGAHELNYISDVDVIFVARSRDVPDPLDDTAMLEVATKLAVAVGRAVSAPAGEPALWILDGGLRPEGKDGPLVRTLDSHVAYYQRWAEGWEFQALLKARPIAGDMVLGRAYLDKLWPLVWSAASRDNFVEESRAMRKRVEDHVPAREEGRQLKLGKGGLRDVEFTVQLLQLVHGRTDENLRVRPTLQALAALRDGGYIARKDAVALDHGYRFLRALEHRIQLQRLRRSHLVPTNDVELRRIARSLGIPEIKSGAELEHAWQNIRKHIRQLHQEIYYRPLLPEAARLSPDDVSLDADSAAARLAAIGYRDLRGAINHIRALTTGVSRTAAIQRQLLPVMLGWFASGPEPDHGLLSFRLLSEKMGRTSWYMRTLRDGGAAAERLCRILASSRYLAEHIPELPESISWLSETHDVTPLSRAQLDQELDSMIGRRLDPDDIAAAGRYLRRRELLRTGIGQTLRLVDPVDSRAAVSHAADIALDAALRGALLRVHGHNEPPADFLIVAMGRLGGEEMGYASDADILVVYRPHDGADSEACSKSAIEVASQLSHVLTQQNGELPLPVDFDLRPEGKQGVLARSLDSYAEYYARWAHTWERQALLRARPCAGSRELGDDFLRVIEPYRYPAGGLSQSELLDIRRMKARVETERIPRGVSPLHHLKLGRGGLSDVEWTAQLIQLQHAGEHEALRVTSTLGVLTQASHLGILTSDEADVLAHAWNLASELRDLNFLGTGRSSSTKIDVLPHGLRDLAVVASLQGRDTSTRHDVEEEYLRATRRSRALVEKIFYGK
ncbi:bifunctional [glutamine synthetase] adenylyltransferase/[glutamine synthetase]-adenylyl-L-tyrosine phosphorylase [Arcanobacterium haemolyticum]|nr:bifunctional [glutamine synthetase] adenylyltransferase/[glutamine synthetase]-adenylyl-L-tyrosine phosphorylase [Arcanobacterium haemolyticum]